jgi:hypothetical protein
MFSKNFDGDAAIARRGIGNGVAERRNSACVAAVQRFIGIHAPLPRAVGR